MDEHITRLNEEIRELPSKGVAILYHTWVIDETGYHIRMGIRTALSTAEIDIKDKDPEMVRRAVRKVLEQYLPNIIKL
jgi:hypothetical protein